jgi:hypothetical protein
MWKEESTQEKCPNRFTIVILVPEGMPGYEVPDALCPQKDLKEIEDHHAEQLHSPQTARPMSLLGS